MRIREPLPRNALTLVDASRMKLLHLMALAIYEKGAPLSYDEIRDRLREIGVDRPVGALQKAWHGRSLLRKMRDGRFHLEQEDAYGDWGYVQSLTRENLERAHPEMAPRKPALAIVPPATKDDRTPLTLEEAHEALRDGPFTTRRVIIALIEATGRPLSIAEIVAELAAFSRAYSSALDVERSLRGLPGPLKRAPDGRIAVDSAHPDMPGIRALVRKHVREAGPRRREVEEQKQRWAESDAQRATERHERRAWYAGATKLLVRTIFDDDRFVGASGFDPDRGAFEDFPDAGSLAARLSQSELVLGLDPRDLFERLGVDVECHAFADLSPPNKTRTIDRRGRTIKITPELLIAGTLGGSRALGDERALIGQLDRGEGKARRRLHADLKALWRFYEYGCLHACVRLRWGFLDEIVPVGWNVGRQPMAHEILVEAGRSGRLVEIVFGAAPGWEDPWSRGCLYRPLALGVRRVQLLGPEGLIEVGTGEIASVRIVGG
jgi:hypothetical protein